MNHNYLKIFTHLFIYINYILVTFEHRKLSIKIDNDTKNTF